LQYKGLVLFLSTFLDMEDRSMRLHALITIPVAAIVVASSSTPMLAATSDSAKTVSSAATTLQEFVNSKRIPPAILRDSQGIAIIPNVIQAAFFL
jgi:lipid-binding SYLF domain-containing protein